MATSPQEERSGSLGFGRRIHYCVGHALARTEMRIGLLEFARRFSEVRLATVGGRQGLSYAPSAMLHGPAAVPARLTLRSR